MKISDVTDEHMKGWTYSITQAEKHFDIGFARQYRAAIKTPNGTPITDTLFFGDDIGLYAFTMKNAERKVIKTIKRLIVDQYNRENPTVKSL